MRFEEVVSALREGREVRRKAWGNVEKMFMVAGKIVLSGSGTHTTPTSDDYHLWLTRDINDWEIIEEIRPVADYLVQEDDDSVIYFKQWYEVGKQPADAVLIPGTERMERR